jgi:hypothetical protein
MLALAFLNDLPDKEAFFEATRLLQIVFFVSTTVNHFERRKILENEKR